MPENELEKVKEALEYAKVQMKEQVKYVPIDEEVQLKNGVYLANEAIKSLNKYTERDRGEDSDGYHTFNELYEHRHMLFSAFMKTNPGICWKSRLHDDGTMFDDWFIAGADLPDGTITYHIPLRLWSNFQGNELVNAPKWDGHTSDDVIDRLKSVKQPTQEP